MRVARHYNWMLAGVSLGLLLGVQAFAQMPARKLHKMLVRPDRNDSIAQLRQGGITNVENFGSFWLVEANDAQASALKKALGGRVSQADQLNRIELGSITLDTTGPEPAIPDDLRQTNPVGKRLRLIQFKGPIQPEWLDQIKAAGDVKIVSYIPNNAYVVSLDDAAEQNIANMMGQGGPVQWLGPYHPYYKFDPSLLQSSESTFKIRVAVVNGPETELSVAALQRFNHDVQQEATPKATEKVVTLTVSLADVAQIAQQPDVVWITRVWRMKPLDESADLILASRTNQLPGHAPLPGIDDYLDFLTNVVGFSMVPEDYPVLDIADTLFSSQFNSDFFVLGNTNNESRSAGTFSDCAPSAVLCDIHADWVTSVAVGANLSTAAENLDSRGFRLGLGVSPFGRFANSIIFSLQGTVCTICQGDFGPPNDFGWITRRQYVLHGARISNNSWGEVVTVGPGGNAGIYDSESQTYDVAVRDAIPTGVVTNGSFAGRLNQELITVFAAGNAGAEDINGGVVDAIQTPPATAKNVITAGASENVRPTAEATTLCGLFAGDADNSDKLASFTSFGPTVDQRFKPEIVAPGTAVFALDALSISNQIYDCVNGTSFAAPAVSGGVQLLWWWFQHGDPIRNEQGQHLLQPSPAMAKAYLCNSARYLPIANPQHPEAQDALPSFAQGMGEMDLARMFDGVPRLIRDETTRRAIDTPLTTTNPVPQQTFFSRTFQSYEVSGVVADSTKPFRVTLAWTDAPGDPAAFKQLVNDLDLEVTIGGLTYKGNNFVGPDSVTNGPADSVNNMESVFLPGGQTGSWNVVVHAANIAGSGVPNVDSPLSQDFALVVYNASAAASARSDVPNPSTNDACQTAVPIGSFPFAFTNNLTKPVFHNVHPSPSAGRGGIDEFFQINLPTMGTRFNLNTIGSAFDTVLSVWRVLVVPQSIFVSGPCGALIEVVSTNAGPQSAVSFTADGSNTYFVVVEPHNDGPGGRMVLNVDATSQVTLSVSNLDFGSQVGGTTSAVQTVTLQNSSPVGVNVANVAIDGANPSDFLIISQNCSGNTIPAGGTCTITLAFAPTTTGPRTARLVVTDDATGSPRTAQLSGNGLPPAPLVCLSAGTVAFGSVSTGTVSTVHSLIITNCGTTNLTISGVAISGVNLGDFQIVANSCSTLPAGGTCSIGLTFTPAGPGARTATLAITNNASGSPHLVLLTGSGSVGQPDAAIGKTTKVKKMVGNGVISSTGAGEEFDQKVKRGAKHGVKFFVSLKNIGTSADGFTVEGTGNSAGFTVKYFLGSTDTTDISSAVESGAHASGTLAPSASTGDATMMRIEIFADKAVPKGTVKVFTIKCTSVADPAKVDVVIARVTAK